jgi:hypothetical protein
LSVIAGHHVLGWRLILARKGYPGSGDGSTGLIKNGANDPSR